VGILAAIAVVVGVASIIYLAYALLHPDRI
jgi:hypothetical protein